jgi:hypothetical protein
MRGTHLFFWNATPKNWSDVARTDNNNKGDDFSSCFDLNCVTLCTTLHRNVFIKGGCVYLIENGKIGKSMAEHGQLLFNRKLWAHINGAMATKNDYEHV